MKINRWIFYSTAIIFCSLIGYFFAKNYYKTISDNNFSQLVVNNKPIKKAEDKRTEIIKSADPVEVKSELPSDFYIDNVPFLSQAPLADWKDERQQDGCEEAVIIMSEAWLNNTKQITKQDGLSKILLASKWFEDNIGTFHDASVEDVIRYFKEALKIETVKIIEEPSLDDYKQALSQGKLVLVPTNGQLLGNPNFSGTGPETHMIVVRGYDDATGEFTTNDPGTRKGENYRYKYGVVLNANLAYSTGYHLKMENIRKAIIVVSR